jgi:arylsulfatase A-like enzyme
MKLVSAAELQEITDTYDSSIAWVDSEFGRILARLKSKGLYDDSLIIFLADHGEAQGEHGVLGHGRNVYDETTKVPLIVKYPKSMNLKGRVRPLVELADIFPTISWFFGQDLALDGRNLLLAGLHDSLDDRMVVSRTGIQPATYGLRWHDWYYIHQPGRNVEKLFLLTADRYREADDPQMRAFLKSRFLDWFSRFRNLNETASAISLKDLPASDIEEMKTLGYL